MSDKTEFTITTNRFRELIDNEKYKNIPRAEIAKAIDCKMQKTTAGHIKSLLSFIFSVENNYIFLFWYTNAIHLNFKKP